MATLVEFTKIHGVGPTTARDLYDKYGCRTIADVEKVSHKLPTMGEESIMCKPVIHITLSETCRAYMPL